VEQLLDTLSEVPVLGERKTDHSEEKEGVSYVINAIAEVRSVSWALERLPVGV